MKTIAIIPAAGFGVRMKTDVPKQFLKLEEKPILAVTLEKFNECALIDGIILVVPTDDRKYCTEEIVKKYNLKKVLKVIPGGARRQDSVRAGIKAIESECDNVLIHDGVRPFVSQELITASISAVKKDHAVITALPAKDTVKKVSEEGYVLKTYERSSLGLVQTPQVFRYDDIYNAHIKAEKENWEEATDDALLMEKMGIPVRVIMGEEKNIKITTPHDLEYAGFLLEKTE